MMSDKRQKGPPSEAHNRHHAEKRRQRRDDSRKGAPSPRPRPDGLTPDGLPFIPEDHVLLYGLHTVRHALANPARRKHRLFATKNALARLEAEPSWLERLVLVEAEPRLLDRLTGPDAVHQGAVLEADALRAKPLKDLAGRNLVLVLDQVTDPHNVGAVMRSAVAFGAGALITTHRHSPAESGVLAKAASGALDLIDHLSVRNLAEALEELAALGFQTVGLDSEGPDILEASLSGEKVALVLGAEGKGLRQKTRETCATLARIDLPGEIRSLNVSNAAVLSLYIARRHLAAR
jgi:23S rRNA (guanosine2251-2'-O)-methyltransferase